jgi:aldose 1-epimerase
VEETAYDFRVARPMRDLELDDAFGDLERDDHGVATVTLRDPRRGDGVALWVDRHHRWVMVYSADDQPEPRVALAVEPMTAPPDAFRSGRDLLTLAPAGEPGDEVSVSWGIRALE